MANPDFKLRPFSAPDEFRDSIVMHLIRDVVPVVEPTPEEMAEVIKMLGMPSGEARCAYCGCAQASYWAHFRPLVSGGEVTGFITEIQNLVPACAPCDKGKGGSHWKRWMLGDTPSGKNTRARSYHKERVQRLEKFELWRPPTQLNFAQLVGEVRWGRYLAIRDVIIQSCKDAEREAKGIRGAIELPTPA